MTIKTNFSADLGFNQFRSYTPVYYVSGLQNNATSSLDRTSNLVNNFNWDNTIEYEFSKGHQNFKILIGSSYQQNFNSKLTGTSYNVPDVSNATLYLNLGDESTRKVGDAGNKDRVQSYFGRINYNYADMYLLTATIRADGSSKYNVHWGYFPSVGVGWVLSEESFMKKQSLFNFLKIRTSWGKLGNNHVPANSLLLLSTSGADQTGIFGGNIAVPGITFQTVYKDTLKWETVTELDGGLEFQVFSKRLNIEIDYYNRLTSNAVFLRPIATVSGTGFLLANNGKIRNHGVEISAGWDDKKMNGKLGYSIHGNLTYISNKVVEIASESGQIFGGSLNGSFITRTIVGKPIGSFYGYKQIGVFQSNGDIENYKGPDDTVLQPDAIPGDLKFQDVTPGKGINNEDRTYLGNPIPKITFGLDAGLTYSNWDVNISFQGVAGNKIFNQKRADRNPFPDANYDYNFYKNHWKGSGSSNTYPSSALSRRNIQPNSFFVESGTYVRIRNVQLGYTLPKEKLKAMKLRIYATAQNLLTLYSYNGYTPEVGGNSPIEMGIDSQTYPASAIYSLGLNVTF
jgi:TonB-linked SusC/RagA family outer membrane protein